LEVSPVFETLMHLARKWLVFPTPPLFDAHSGRTPCDINEIYTPLKRTFNKLQFRQWQYGSIFICLATVGSEICEIRRCHITNTALSPRWTNEERLLGTAAGSAAGTKAASRFCLFLLACSVCFSCQSHTTVTLSHTPQSHSVPHHSHTQYHTTVTLSHTPQSHSVPHHSHTQSHTTVTLSTTANTILPCLLA